ncbi:hypothetical protein HN592_01810 [Candidatus Woesearchaeota archaeon]|jgi:hypothetical protein|nr:hypothetical protein [Candidatus Woesearchaeota archaeon]MBT4368582.1 hypothetical protein [Candidatus Woesearchaeota archaeon]MBT4713109.1 hypothetical protein [Candidatus Woesearchaeota archaeon]MBT6639031.1 hypothetical protein [Candidatus Woesearchaeota archaeon]MBT7134230.1 hypothetical protein [Candidatus Woesearchaeota archaeon]
MDYPNFKKKIDPAFRAQFFDHSAHHMEHHLKKIMDQLTTKYDSYELEFWEWIAEHVHLMYDLKDALEYLNSNFSAKELLDQFRTARTLGRVLYAGFYTDYFKGKTGQEILAENNMDNHKYYEKIKEIIKEIEKYRDEINQNGKILKTERQSMDFYYLELYPALKRNKQLRFYLTANPLHLRDCIFRLLEELFKVANEDQTRIDFKFYAGGKGYRRDSIVIYGQKKIKSVIKDLPDNWFLESHLPFGKKIASGRTITKDKGKEINEKVLDSRAENSNGSALTQILADVLYGTVKHNDKMPEKPEAQFNIILDVCYNLFIKRVKIHDGL